MLSNKNLWYATWYASQFSLLPAVDQRDLHNKKPGRAGLDGFYCDAFIFIRIFLGYQELLA